MKTKHFYNPALGCLAEVTLLICILPTAAADSPNSNSTLTSEASDASFNLSEVSSFFAAKRPVRYRLVEGSMLVDECIICGRPPIPVPIRGTFWLELTGRDMWFLYFAVRGLRFTSFDSQFKYIGQLEGKYEIGGDFAYVHQMALQGRINDFNDLEFDSGVAFPQTPFPWIEIDLYQVPPTDPLHTFTLHLVAVPWPAVLFSTETGFTSSVGMRHISDGDLLSSTGRVVRTNSELTAGLGIMPPAPDIGLDAVMWPTRPNLSRWEVWFSPEKDILSEKLGPLGNGDLLSSAGRVIRRNSELIKPFAPQPPAPDIGLDAVARGPDGILLFSTEEGFFSESLGVSVGDGDLLREDGKIFKSGSDLLAKFHPIEPRPIPFGLDAVFVWPHGEVWFSIEVDFVDDWFGPIGNGDLLSDIGRIVARNKELLAPFRPVEDIADFGLDALQIFWPYRVADLDFNGSVDFIDFAIFTSVWKSNANDLKWNPDCDINIPTDDLIDSLDLGLFAEQWLEFVAP